MLGDNIRKYRKANNLSQEELAERLGVSRQSISLWETGKTQPSIDMLANLASAVDVSVDALLAATESIEPTRNENVQECEQSPFASTNKPSLCKKIGAIILISLLSVAVVIGLVFLFLFFYDKPLTAEEINEYALQYVGEITTYNKFGKPRGIGTGFICTSDGNVITNYHVIEGAYSAEFSLGDETYTIQKVLSYDSDTDLVVLKIDGEDFNCATMTTTEPEAGSTVYAIGSSQGLTNTFSKGIVTYYNREIDGINYIQHDASITNGNSGGPLLNEKGEVIGVNTWGLDDAQNLNFAVNISELQNLEKKKPITMKQMFEQFFDPDIILKEWIQENYNSSSEDPLGGSPSFSFEKALDGWDFSVTINYSGNLMVDLQENDGSGYANGLGFVIYLDDNTFLCDYWPKGDAFKSNVTEGSLDYSNIYSDNRLEISAYRGGYEGNKDELLKTYKKGLQTTLSLFQDFLEEKGLGITVSDFGIG